MTSAEQSGQQRHLIVNADDFGRSHGVNRGIIQAHVHGIVTSASLMVRWPAAREAAALAGDHPALGLGLHVDMGEWIYRDGDWAAVYEVVPADAGGAEIEAEVQRQVAAFRELTGRDPDHLDSHQHVHRDEPLRSILSGIGAALRIPVRSCSPAVAYCGAFYGQGDKAWPNHEAIGVGHLCSVLRNLPNGVTELACHPGLDNDFDSVYLAERVIEVETLCDPKVRTTLKEEGVHLCSFAEAPLPPA